MKFVKEEPSAVDKDVNCPIFKLNKQECQILHALIANAKVYLPKALYPDRGRLSNMEKELAYYLKIKKPPKTT